MSKQTIIKPEQLITNEEAQKLLGDISYTTLRKFINDKYIRRVKDKTDGSSSYIYKPDIEQFIQNRFYFEGDD